MKKVDLSQLSTSDLQEKLTEERNALDKIRFTHAISPVENPMKIPHTKKNIARMLTELRKRELNEIKGTTPSAEVTAEPKKAKAPAAKKTAKSKTPKAKTTKSKAKKEAVK